MKYDVHPESLIDVWLYNAEAGQVFARKLLRLAQPDPRTARNELRAIQKLCDGRHKNIIKVFDFGDLPDASHVFIDMELCSLNLDNYNKGIRTTILVHEAAANFRIAEIWSIIAQIADALAFIHAHREIHRDLKPQNVLYSRVDKVWKVADFGLTSEGTSQSLQSTEFARGTPGYRAPELIQEEKSAYNNKVDIWALGCILYELVIGTKPFATDIAVLEHYRAQSSVELAIDESFDARSRRVLSEAIHEMFQKDPSLRPSASTLLDRFSIHRTIAKAESMQLQPLFENSSIIPVEAHRPDLTDCHSIFRNVNISPTAPPSNRKSPVRSPASSGLKHFVQLAIVNIGNTRMVTVSLNGSSEPYSSLCRITLWDTSSGEILWEQRGPLGYSPTPAFTSDGRYFGIYDTEKRSDQKVGRLVKVGRWVNVFSAEDGSRVRYVDLPWKGEALAIAISRNRVAVAINVGALDVTSALQDVAMLVDSGAHLDRNVDVVETRGVSDISLAYDHDERYLRAVSMLIGSKKGPVSFSWDTISRRAPTIFQPQRDTLDFSRCQWTTPLCNMPCNNLTFFCGYYSNAYSKSYVCINTTTQFYGAFLAFNKFAVFSFNTRGLLVLAEEDLLDMWDIKRKFWIRAQNQRQRDLSDKTVYKYLVRCEGKGLVENGGQIDATFVAKIAWDDMPILREVRGLAETEAGLTLIMEDEKVVFISKEQMVL